ncbi:MAG: YdcF family protein [Anaerolineaceae bacterium]
MNTKVEQKTGKKKKSTVQKFIILLVILFFCLFLFRAMGSFLVVSSELEYANAIVVLSGGDESRMQEALELYNQNYSNLIILTETGDVVEGYDYLHSFDMRIELLNNGVPSGNILMTDQVATSTEEEAEAVKRLLTNRQLISCIVVTDPYHTRRAYTIFKDTFADTGIKVMIHPTSPHWFNANTWFLKIKGWHFVVLEYIKYLSYKLGG